jgi:hypothetical protein
MAKLRKQVVGVTELAFLLVARGVQISHAQNLGGDVRGAVDLTPLRAKFAGDNKDLQAEFDDLTPPFGGTRVQGRIGALRIQVRAGWD